MPSFSADASARFWSAHLLRASPPAEVPRPLDKGKAVASFKAPNPAATEFNPAANDFGPSLDLTTDIWLTERVFLCFLSLDADVPVHALEAAAMELLAPLRRLHHWSEARILSIKQQAIEQIMPHRKEYMRKVRAGRLHQARQQWAQLSGPPQWKPMPDTVYTCRHRQWAPQGFGLGEVQEPEVDNLIDSGYGASKLASRTLSGAEAPQPYRPDSLLLQRILEWTLARTDRLGALEPTERCESPLTWQLLPPIGCERPIVR